MREAASPGDGTVDERYSPYLIILVADAYRETWMSHDILEDVSRPERLVVQYAHFLVTISKANVRFGSAADYVQKPSHLTGPQV